MPQTSMKEVNMEYIIDNLDGHKKTSKETLSKVCWYGYDCAVATLGPEASIPTRFVNRCWSSALKLIPENFSQLGRRR